LGKLKPKPSSFVPLTTAVESGHARKILGLFIPWTKGRPIRRGPKAGVGLLNSCGFSDMGFQVWPFKPAGNFDHHTKHYQGRRCIGHSKVQGL